MIKKITSGSKISISGLISTLLFFFLPWVLTSCGNDPMREFSGWQLAIGEGGGEGYKGNIVVLLFLIASLVLLFLAFRSSRLTSVSIAVSYGVTVTSIVVLLLLFQQFLTPPAEGINREILYGLWGYIVSWIVALIGGVVNIVERRKQVVGGTG